MLDIVLYEPEIPPNTGNIGRLCVANNLRLHLIKPLGFELNDKYLKRAGMDYWQYLDFTIHVNWSALCSCLGVNKTYWFFSTKGRKTYWQPSYQVNDVLVFGPETRGLPVNLLKNNSLNTVCIPMFGDKQRSLNLSTSVGIASYEALRQIKLITNAGY